MSARAIAVLALVACVAIHANSYPYGAKGGPSYVAQESYSAPAKGYNYYAPEPKGFQQQQWQQPARQQTFVSAPAQYEAAPVKGSPEPRYLAPRVAQTTYVQQHFESAPVKGQSYYVQEPARVEQPHVAAQIQEPLVSSPTVVQASPAPVQTSQVQEQPLRYEAPVKGQSFFQQSFQAAPAKGQYFYEQQQPVRVSAQEQLVSAPQAQSTVVQSTVVQAEPVIQAKETYRYEAPRAVKGQSYTQQHFEYAPAKGQSFYAQETQQLRAPLQASQEPLTATAQVQAVPVQSAPALKAN